MQVQVILFANLHENRFQNVELSDRPDAKDLIHHLRIPIEEVSVQSVNGRQATFDQQLKSGDLIHIIPPIGGGRSNRR